jgi:cardiolipin synthase
MSRNLRAPFPFVSLQTAKLFHDAKPTWGQIFSDFQAAEETLFVENYILEDGIAGKTVIQSLCDASKRGVTVKLHIDGFGSNHLGKNLLSQLEESNVELKIFNNPPSLPIALFKGISRFFRRTHRRIIVVDGHIAWVGGLAFGDPWWPSEDEPTTRDTMLRVTGPVAEQVQKSFAQLWSQPSRSLPSKVVVPAEESQVRAIPQHPIRAQHFRKSLYRRIHDSSQRIWLATPYFIPNFRLRRALLHAVRRGVDVRILLPGAKNHDHPAVRIAAHRHYGHLLHFGVKIFEYQPSFMHAKVGLFDNGWTLIGSANLDRLSFFVNHELILESRSQDLAEETRQQFEADFAQSVKISLSQWRNRSLFHRVRERFFGLFDRIL